MTSPARPARIGCSEIPAGVLRPQYFKKLRFLELARTYDRLTKLAPLRKRRREVPEDFGFSLVASRLLGSKAAEDVAAEVERLASAAEAVSAEALVFRTPADFVPSQKHREELERFFNEVATAERFGDAARVWEPLGLWEPRATSRIAEQLGLVIACDPLATDPTQEDPMWVYELPNDAAYLRVRALGMAGALPPHILEEIQEIASTYSRAWIVIDTGDAFRDAVRLQKSWSPLDAPEPT